MRSVSLNNIGYDKSNGFDWGGLMLGQDQYCITSLYRFPISLLANEKMFSIRALADNPHTGFARLASNSSTSYLYAYRNRYNTIDFSNYVIDFYGYATSPSSGIGLQAFDANGDLVFDSNKYYFDVKGRYNIQHADGTAREFAQDTTTFPRNINIGGPSRSNSAVVIDSGSYNMCKFGHDHYSVYPFDIVYALVFNKTAYLEPRIAFWVYEWSTWSNPSNHNGYPNFSRLSSGIVLDTTNIS